MRAAYSLAPLQRELQNLPEFLARPQDLADVSGLSRRPDRPGHSITQEAHASSRKVPELMHPRLKPIGRLLRAHVFRCTDSEPSIVVT